MLRLTTVNLAGTWQTALMAGYISSSQTVWSIQQQWSSALLSYTAWYGGNLNTCFDGAAQRFARGIMDLNGEGCSIV